MKTILEVRNLKKVFKKANGESHTAVNGIFVCVILMIEFSFYVSY